MPPMPEAVAASPRRNPLRKRPEPVQTNRTASVFEYIEMFYNPTRKHMNKGMPSPIDLENRQQKLNEVSVQKTRGYSLLR
jgi:putative transposase